jgi:hypothetical protein
MTTMPIARTTDPETSHEAARSITGLRRSQRDVLRVLRSYGPMTDEQLVARYTALAKLKDSALRPQSPSGIRTRRAELRADSLVRDSGTRATMTTGRRAIVWEVSDAR